MYKVKQDRLLNRNLSRDEFYSKYRPPPPPPGKEDYWDLQFCRWWGWNWVRKPDKVIPAVYRLPRRYPQKKVKRKHFRDLYNCLCFKKRPKPSTSLQKLYGTPSNSVVLRETHPCGDSLSGLEVQRNISRSQQRRQHKRAIYTMPLPTLEDSSSCSCSFKGYQDELSCYSCSSERSLSRVHCNHQKHECPYVCPERKPVLKKIDFQTQTTQKDCGELAQCENQVAPCQNQLPQCQNQVAQCQNQEAQCIIGIQDQNQKNCCGCDNDRKCQKENVIDNLDHNCMIELLKGQNLCPGMKRRYMPPCNECIAATKIGHESCQKWLNNNTFLKEYKPWDNVLYGNHKCLTKFGLPSRKYQLVQTTRSDILDKYYTMKLSEEFSSPISGKTFNLSPIRFENFDGFTTSTLPDPIEVEEDIKYLNSLEEQVKMDLESRVMLDSVCDAILYDKRVREVPSMLNDFTYTDEIENTIFEPFHTHLPQKEIELSHKTKLLIDSYTGVERDFVEPQKTRLKDQNYCDCREDKCPDTYIPMNSMHQSEQQILEEIRDLLKMLFANRKSKLKKEGMENYSKPVNATRGTPCNIDDTIKVSNKRTASPVAAESVKKMKTFKDKKSGGENFVNNADSSFKINNKSSKKSLRIQNAIYQTSSTKRKEETECCSQTDQEEFCSNGSDNTIDGLNTSEIFNKIDEIIMRSKHNSDDIQSVLNTIPKKSGAICDVDCVNICSSKISREKRCEELASNQLAMISESVDEYSPERQEVAEKINPVLKKKSDSKALLIVKKKKKNSLIPVKQSKPVNPKK
ncbi:hypothetical protein JTB14_018411 [Gonioctena quinquepunctata]|nr:hypothetical protein JTB14_018411 [Gonioctena quinquepunctata]